MKNKYEIRGEITAIFIKSPKYGQFEALISTVKLDRVNELIGTWYVRRYKDTFYVQGQGHSLSNRVNEVVSLHRWVTNAPKGMVVDHFNHDTLNNIDENLRVCTIAENSQNRRGAMRNNVTGIRGVYWSKQRNKWAAEASLNKKIFHLGMYNNIEDAEKVVIEFRKKNMPFSNESTA